MQADDDGTVTPYQPTSPHTGPVKKSGYAGFDSLEISTKKTQQISSSKSTVNDQLRYKLYRYFLVVPFGLEGLNILSTILFLWNFGFWDNVSYIFVILLSIWDMFQISWLYKAKTIQDLDTLNQAITSIKIFMQVTPVLATAMYFFNPRPLRKTALDFLPWLTQGFILIACLIILESLLYVVYLYPARKIRNFLQHGGGEVDVAEITEEDAGGE